MAEVTTAGLADGGNPTLPLVTRVKSSDMPTCTISRKVTVDGVHEKRSATLPFLSDETEPEVVLRLFKDYADVFPASRMNLTTGILRFEFLRQCLGGVARDQWDVDAGAVGNTLANFVTCQSSFIDRYLRATDLPDQQTYLDTTKKPYKLSVKELSARLQYVNSLMALYPGAGGVVPYDDNALKLKLYKMMLPEWKTTFQASGTSIASADFSFRDLTQYMSVQENALVSSRA